jgi:hypothetical protein
MARPDLQRRLYASHDVIENYKNYNMNQKQYLEEIIKNNGKPTNEVMEMIELNKRLSRPLDRPKLKLKPKYKSSSETDSDNESNTSDVDGNDSERMKELIDMWWNADSIIGKILKFIYESQIGVNESELKEYLKQNKYSKAWVSDLSQKHKDYKYVFEKNNNIIKIKNEASNYISSK